MTKSVRSEPAPAPASPLRRFLPLALLAALIVLAVAMGWHRQLTLENIAANRDRMQAFIAGHGIVAPLVYMVAYAVAVALSLPGALVLTLTGGLLFGTLLGGLFAVIGATVGAVLLYLIAAHVLGGASLASLGTNVEGSAISRTPVGKLLIKSAPLLGKLEDGFKENALSYLLFLRLVPAFPFWLVNLAPALLGVPLRTFIIGTFFGIIPGTLAYASVGAGLDGVIAAAKTGQAACIAAKGAAACPLQINVSALVNPQLILAFVLLGLVALIPIVLKKWRSGHGR